LRATVDKFDQACQNAENDDSQGHNDLMQEVRNALSDVPTSILTLVDFSSWLQGNMEQSLEPVFKKLDETQELLTSI
jgi:hypothetical protein